MAECIKSSFARARLSYNKKEIEYQWSLVSTQADELTFSFTVSNLFDKFILFIHFTECIKTAGNGQVNAFQWILVLFFILFNTKERVAVDVFNN